MAGVTVHQRNARAIPGDTWHAHRSAARPRQEGGRSSAPQHDSQPRRFEGRGAAGNADGVQHKRQKVDVPAEPSGGAE